MAPLSRPVRQFAAVGLLLAAVVLIASLTVLPVASRIGELREQIEGERLLLGRFAAMAALQDKLAEMQGAGRAASESEAYLKGESDAIRAASLQTILSELAGANGVRLSSTRQLPSRDRDDLRLVGTRVQFTADMEQLREMLYFIESTQPFLFVEALQARPFSALAQRDHEYGGLLDVRLDVFGALPRRRG
jgi:general secretion pathway protein M